MKKILLFIGSLVVIYSCNSSLAEQNIPASDLIKLQKKELSEEKKKHLENEISYFDSYSLREMQREFSAYYKRAPQEYELYQNTRKADLQGYRKSYDKNEEEFMPYNIDLNYRKKDSVFQAFIKSGLTFAQRFDNDTNKLYILLHPNIDGGMLYVGSKKKTFGSYPSLSGETFETKSLKKVWYMNGESEEDVQSDWLYFLNSMCVIGRKLPVDSMLVNYKLSQISEVDSIDFFVEDLGDMAKGITIEDYEKNFVKYTNIGDDIIDVVAYNSEGKALDTEYSYTDGSRFQDSLTYANWYASYRELKDIISQVKTKEEAIRVLEYFYIKDYNDESYVEKETVHHYFKGNVAKIRFYIERNRREIEFDVLFVNGSPDQPYFTNTVGEKTELIDIKGNVKYVIPVKDLNFVTTKEDVIDRGKQNINYLENFSHDYYFDYNKGEAIELDSLTSCKCLSDHIVKAYNKNSRGVIVLDTNLKQVLPQTFKRVKLNGELIIATEKTYEEYLLIIDANGRVLHEGILYVEPEFEGVYRVVKDYKVGFMNAKGEWLVAPKYEYMFRDFIAKDPNLRGELQIVLDGKLGLVDLTKKAKLTVPCVYDALRPVENGRGDLYYAEKDGKIGVIDINGKMVEAFEEVGGQ